MKISTKILVVLLCSIAGTLGVYTNFETDKQAANLLAAEEAKIISIVVTSLGSLSVTMWNYDVATIQSTLDILMMVDNIEDITLYGKEGEFYQGANRKNGQPIIVASGEDLPSLEGFPSTSDPDLRKLVTPPSVLSDVDHTRQLRSTIWYQNDDIPTLVGYMVVTYDVSGIHESIRQMKNRLLQTSLLLAILICLSAFILLRILVISRILKLHEVSRQLAEGKYVSIAGIKGKDEMSDLMTSFNQMSNALKQYAERMEQQVEEKTQDIRYLLDLMPIGVVSLEEGGRFRDLYSRQAPVILEESHLSGMNISILLERSSLSEDDRAQLSSAISCSIGLMEIAYFANESHLVKELRYTGPSGKARHLELSWTPVSGADGIVRSIIITFIDVTEQRSLRESENKRNAYLKIIDELLVVGERRFAGFVTSFDVYYRRSQALLSTNSTLTKDQLDDLLIQIHTMKGNARSVNLSSLANAIHVFESGIAESRRDPGSPNLSRWLAEMNSIGAVLHTYEVTARSKLKFRTQAVTKTVEVDKADLQSLLNLSLDKTNPAVNRLRGLLRDDTALSLADAIAETITSLEGIAAKAGKPTPIFDIAGAAGVMFSKAAANWLQAAFNHLVTNSLDHGIETLEERRARQKPLVPKLSVVITEQPSGWVRLSYADDGCGVNLSRLREKALAIGAAIPECDSDQLLNLIFMSGVTTKEAVTELSGRGTGMSAVKMLLEEQGCRVELKRVATSDDGFAMVTFVLDIPPHHIHAFVG